MAIRTLLMPIFPEPASRLYAGVKWYELRKRPPPFAGMVYLYEREDVHAIRGAFYFKTYLELPREDLWKRVGTLATSRERFDAYFGAKYSTGYALAISRVERLREAVTFRELSAIDASFRFPAEPWTYADLDKYPAVVQYLHGLPRAFVLERPDMLRREPDRQDQQTTDEHVKLTVAKAATTREEAFCRQLYESEIRPYYEEVDDYFDSVIESVRSGFDPYGYFTKRKSIWIARADERPVGFTVVTEKRGGSIKFGPSAVAPDARGRGIAAQMRLKVEREYPAARKAYNTLSATNPAALRYVLSAGYRVEAHLLEQYRRSASELVVGKVLVRRGPLPTYVASAPAPGGPLSVRDVTAWSEEELQAAAAPLLQSSYSEIDTGFFRGIRMGELGGGGYARKEKRVILAIRSGIPVGVAVLTPKRGGALKCSPLFVVHDDREAFTALIHRVREYAAIRESRKLYAHVALMNGALTRMLLEAGFVPEGVLQEPYKEGVDMLAMGKVL